MSTELNNVCPPVKQGETRKISICIRNLSKKYPLYNKPSDFLKEIINHRPYHREFWALKDINFDVYKGEVVGIVGSNGAGKSTLLKILTGTLSKTTGDIKIQGKISAILELGTGFDPEHTGRENILMGCLCVGMTKKEAALKLESIIDFSELRAVIDQPFKTYSSGMQARLTFATAISVEPDIFIVDEALAAGDAYFASKCSARIREICKSGATVLFVSHSSHQVAQLCDRAVWIENGAVRAIGNAREISKLYDYEVHRRISGNQGEIVDIELHKPLEVVEVVPSTKQESLPEALLNSVSEQLSEMASGPSSETLNKKVKIFRKGPVFIDKVQFLNKQGKEESIFQTWDCLKIQVWYQCKEEAPEDTLGLAIGIEREMDYTLISQFSTCNVSKDEELVNYLQQPYRLSAGTSGFIEANIELQMLEGRYIVSLGLIPNIPFATDFYEYHHRVYPLHIQRAGFPSGAIFYPHVEWVHYRNLTTAKHEDSKLENLTFGS